MDKRTPDYVLKLDRAQDHLKLLTVEMAHWMNEDFKPTVREPADEHGRMVLRWPDESNVPEMWATYLGDIAHNLTSALDCLAYQAIVANNEKPGKNSGFPVHDSEAQWMNAVEERPPDKGPHCLVGVSDPVFGVIKGLQPYHERKAKDRKSHPLQRLRQLSNADKHRLVHVVECRVGNHPAEVEVLPHGFMAVERIKVLKPGGRVEPGADAVRLKLRWIRTDSPETDIDLHAQIPVEPVFGEPDKRERTRVQELDRMLQQVAIAIDLVELALGRKPSNALGNVKRSAEAFHAANPQIRFYLKGD